MAFFNYNKSGIQNTLKGKLLTWPGHRSEKWTVSDACKGTLILGATGSGKSSSSGALLAKSFLEFGYGGLVLCAKKDEVHMWKKFAEETGRTDDLVIFQNRSHYQFNPLEYEQNREGDGAGDVQNIVEILMTLYEMSNNLTAGDSGRGDERFWTMAMRRLLTRSIQLLQISKKEISFGNIYNLITSVLHREIKEQYINTKLTLDQTNLNKEEKKSAKDFLAYILENSFCLRCLDDARKRHQNNELNDEESEIWGAVKNYFFNEFVELSDRTASVIKESALGIVFPFQIGLLKRHFSTTVSPEMKPELAYQEGKIFVMDISVKEYLISGILGQGVFKLAFQQAMERRVFPDDDELGPRPVFLWADEAQNFYSSHDTLFASTARSSLVSIVNLTQNLPSIIVAMGSNKAQQKAMSLIGNLSTKIFHANSDPETNKLASEMIDKVKVKKKSISKAGDDNLTTSIGTQLEYQVLPGDFTTLWTGGYKFGLQAQAYVVETGEMYKEANYMLVTFDQ